MGYRGACARSDLCGIGVLMPQTAPSTGSAGVLQPPPAVVPAAPADKAARERERLANLVRRMAEQDESALAAFYDATVGNAYGVALRIVGSPALAEECVADAFHQAWREAGRYDSERSNPLTWLLMICRSRALDRWRSRDPAVAHEDPSSLLADVDCPRDDDPLNLLTAVEARRSIHAALAALAPVQRQMIALAFFRGLSHAEIATHTRQPIGTVKSQIRRALAVLRRALDVPQGMQP